MPFRFRRCSAIGLWRTALGHATACGVSSIGLLCAATFAISAEGEPPRPPLSPDPPLPGYLQDLREPHGLDNTPPGGTLPGGTLPGGSLPGGTLPGGTLEGGTPEGGTLPGGTVEGGTPEGGTLPGGTLEGGTLEGGTLPGGPL